MNRQHLSEPDPKDQLEAILERALTAYHRDECHGGARWIGERVLDAELVPVTREAFREADDLPSDEEVLQTLDGPMLLLGEGYHVIALAEPQRRFVVKSAKHHDPVPPLATPPSESRPEWQHEYGVRADGSLHPAIWQHVRAFEAYGPLAVPSRAYIADSAASSLSADERRVLGLVVQTFVTPLATAIDRALRAGNVPAARDLEVRYREFTQQLWHCGVSHLDFSMLNIGLVGSGPTDGGRRPHRGA